MKCWIFLPALAVAGCAANSGVAPLGGDAFVVTRQAATGFSGSGNLKGEALSEAGQFCAGQNKSLMVTNAKETGPPYVMGNFPKADVEFMCLAPGDPRLMPPSQKQAAAITSKIACEGWEGLPKWHQMMTAAA